MFVNGEHLGAFYISPGTLAVPPKISFMIRSNMRSRRKLENTRSESEYELFGSWPRLMFHLDVVQLLKPNHCSESVAEAHDLQRLAAHIARNGKHLTFSYVTSQAKAAFRLVVITYHNSLGFTTSLGYPSECRAGL